MRSVPELECHAGWVVRLWGGLLLILTPRYSIDLAVRGFVCCCILQGTAGNEEGNFALKAQVGRRFRARDSDDGGGGGGGGTKISVSKLQCVILSVLN